MEKQHSGSLHPTATALLTRAVAVIDGLGEQGVRVEEISAHCGVSITSLYHHFGNREGLIEAAQAERFARTNRTNIARFEADVDAATHMEELRPLVRRWVRQLADVSAAPIRQVRAEVLASALSRPKLRDQIVELNRAQFDRVGAVLDRAKDRGLLRADLDSRSSAITFTCLTFGRVMAEIDPVDGPGSDEFYVDFAVKSLDELLFGRS